MIARSRSLLLGLLLVTVGCGGITFTSPRRTTTIGGRGSQANNGGTVPHTTPGDPSAYLNQLDAHLRSRQFAPAGSAIRNNAMPSTGLVAYAIDVVPGRCYAAIAIGDNGTDLNMVVLDPFGGTEGHNVQPDSTPWVSFCPRQQGRYIVRLQMSSGQGGYYYLAYQGNAGQDPQLAAFFQSSGGGTQVATGPAPRTAQIDAATRRRLDAVGTRLTSERYTSVSEPIGVVLERSDERVYPLILSAGTCYQFATFGGPGTSDTDVAILDGSGTELASDASGDQDAITPRFCPPSNGTYRLRARLYSGNGPVFVTGWSTPRDQGSTATAGTSSGNSGSVLSGNSTAGAGLTEAYALLDIDMQARGYAVLGSTEEGTLEASGSREFAIQVENDKCYAIAALGDSSVRNIDLTLVDGAGRTVDSETEVSGRSIVRTCASSSGARTVRLAMAAGNGHFKFAVYQFTRGTRGPFGLAGLTWVRLSEVTALLQTENYQPSLDFDIESGRFTAGRAVTANLQLAANKCYAIVVAGGDGVSSLTVALERGGNAVADNTTGSSFPDVRICTTSVTAGRHTMRITPTNGAGPYAYQVFERPVQ